tara:strand:- start:786 stop:1118 length:333 start_codon:yes stop_codon:yes gene_type:complete
MGGGLMQLVAYGAQDDSISLTDLQNSGATEEEFKSTRKQIKDTSAYRVARRGRFMQRVMILGAAITGSRAKYGAAALMSAGMGVYHASKESKQLNDQTVIALQIKRLKDK